MEAHLLFRKNKRNSAWLHLMGHTHWYTLLSSEELRTSTDSFHFAVVLEVLFEQGKDRQSLMKVLIPVVLPTKCGQASSFLVLLSFAQQWLFPFLWLLRHVGRNLTEFCMLQCVQSFQVCSWFVIHESVCFVSHGLLRDCLQSGNWHKVWRTVWNLL